VSIEVAPSALSFFRVASRWCSITLRFLKYVTYNPVRTLSSYIPQELSPSPKTIVLTQLLAHALSNSLSSGAQTSFAFLSSRTLSMMLWRSRHLKKLSRPSQHCARAVRSGAMKPPSLDAAGGAGEGCAEEPPNQLIVRMCVLWYSVDCG
jgi:hypothetical protein